MMKRMQSGGSAVTITSCLRWITVIGLVAMSVGCRRMDERAVYQIARDYLVQQVGADVEVSSRGESKVAVNKNMARVDLDYRMDGSQPVEGYITVWCKRVRMRWEFERATDSRNRGWGGGE